MYSHTPASAEDKFTARALGILIISAFISGIIFTFWTLSEILLFPLWLIAIPVWLSIIVIQLAKAVRRRLLKRSLSLVAALILFVPVCRTVSVYPAEYIHLFVMYSYYEDHLNRSPDGHPLKTKFSWGGSGFATTVQTDRTLVFDPSDDTAKTRTNLELEYFEEKRHLIGHYYIVIVTGYSLPVDANGLYSPF
jgi:hypothetical protein